MQAYPQPPTPGNGAGATIITPQQQRQFSEFLAKHDQALLPLARLVEQSQLSIDELICAMGKAAIEALLQLSAAEVAGPKQQGQRGNERQVVHHGTQDGIVELAERKLSVKRPRLRRRAGGQGGEVPIPLYEKLRADHRFARRAMQILMHGVSTRSYEKVLPKMAHSLGISRSAISRKVIVEGEKALQELAERRFDDREILIIYIDGMVVASHHILAAVGIDCEGYKHVLGMCQGASENATVATALLESMVQRGIKPDRRRLFVIDGSKALRCAIDCVYGENPVQRCRNHKLRNVLGYLPEEQHEQASSALKAAWKLPAQTGIARLEQLAKWYEKSHPGAASSIREGLEEMFTINRLGLPSKLRRCLGTTNLIDSGHSTIRAKSRRVSNWRDGAMVLRWAACAFLAVEAGFNRTMGYEQLWMLKASLDEAREVEERQKTG